jgi:hypothetical protein
MADPTPWRREVFAEVERMAGLGDPASRIAEKLTHTFGWKFTRNMVISACKRRGLRLATERQVHVLSGAAAVRAARARSAEHETALEPEDTPPERPIGTLEALGVMAAPPAFLPGLSHLNRPQFTDIPGRAECAWPGTLIAPQVEWCRQPVRPRSAYCVRHAALASHGRPAIVAPASDRVGEGG